MAKCPACGRRLHFTDWKQFCPGCNVNLVYYEANERLLDESEKAEIEHARFQPKVDRGKAAFFGSPLAIAKIVFFFLPIGALFLPLITLAEEKISVINIYQYITQTDVGGIFSSAFSGDGAMLALVLLLYAVVMLIVNVFLTFISLGRLGKARNIVAEILPLCAVVAAAFLVSGSLIEGKIAMPSWGTWVIVALFAMRFLNSIAIAIVGIPVEYKKCLIGGIPSDRYFSMVESGMSTAEIRREMLIRLTALQEEAEKNRIAEEKEAEEKRRKRR